jgi:hypothetical protein
MQIPRTCPLTLVDKVNFLPLTKPNPTDNLGYVKVSQQHIDAEKCDDDDDDWSHWNSNKRFTEKSGSHTRKSLTESLPKTTILRISHTMWKALQSET